MQAYMKFQGFFLGEIPWGWTVGNHTHRGQPFGIRTGLLGY